MPLTCVFKCFAVKKKQGKAAYGVSPTLLPLHSERLGKSLALGQAGVNPVFESIYGVLVNPSSLPSGCLAKVSCS